MSLSPSEVLASSCDLHIHTCVSEGGKRLDCDALIRIRIREGLLGVIRSEMCFSIKRANTSNLPRPQKVLGACHLDDCAIESLNQLEENCQSTYSLYPSRLALIWVYPLCGSMTPWETWRRHIAERYDFIRQFRNKFAEDSNNHEVWLPDIRDVLEITCTCTRVKWSQYSCSARSPKYLK